MKRYRVWMQDTFADITAEYMNMYVNDGNPVKIRFYVSDVVIAEFYCDNICGWAEVNYAVESQEGK